jgi:Bacterial Ig domain/Fibronectin type III domain
MVAAKIACMNHENHKLHIKSLIKRFALALVAFGSLCSAHAAQVSLLWDSSDSSVAGYKLYYGTQTGNYTDSVSITTGTATTVQGLSKGVTYYFVVKAFNQAGVESLPSNEAVFQVPANAAPVVNLDGPADDGNFHSPASVTLSATASDTDGAVAKVEFYVGSNKVGEATSAPYQVSVSATQAGDYGFSAVAYDNDGATSQAASAFHVRKLAVASTKRNTNGTFELTVNGAAGRQVRIMASEDLVRWTPIETVTNTTGSFAFTDTDAASYSQRFYKIESVDSTNP